MILYSFIASVSVKAASVRFFFDKNMSCCGKDSEISSSSHALWSRYCNDGDPHSLPSLNSKTVIPAIILTGSVFMLY